MRVVLVVAVVVGSACAPQALPEATLFRGGTAAADTAATDATASGDSAGPADAVAARDGPAQPDLTPEVLAPDGLAPADAVGPDAADAPALADTLAAAEGLTDAVVDASPNADGNTSNDDGPGSDGTVVSDVDAVVPTDLGTDATAPCPVGTLPPDCTACAGGFEAVPTAKGKTCAADFPAWGTRPDSPPGAWFTKNGDGTVTDTHSGLRWQLGQSPAGQTWDAAHKYCHGLTLGAPTAWRVPTVAELTTLRDLAKAAPAVATAFAGTAADFFWTAVTLETAPDEAWLVFFNTGLTTADAKTFPAQVRCVATAVAPTAPTGGPGRFVVNAAAGTVLDQATQLTWERAVTLGSYGQAAAKGYCAGLQLAGGGWRLPTLNELEGLVDRRAAGPAIAAVAFPATPPVAFWSSAIYVGTPDNAWRVAFEFGYAAPGKSSEVLRVRCVR